MNFKHIKNFIGLGACAELTSCWYTPGAVYLMLNYKIYIGTYLIYGRVKLWKVKKLSMKAMFTVVEDKPDVLCIRDVGHDVMSVTNDAEAVVATLAPQLGDRRLEYYDSSGNRDQLLVKDGKFAGFAPAGDL